MPSTNTMPFYRFSEVDRMSGETRCCDENAAFGFLPGERTVERLQLRAAHCVLPPLGLHVNLLESQLIERDNAVDAGIARVPTLCRSLRLAPG